MPDKYLKSGILSWESIFVELPAGPAKVKRLWYKNIAKMVSKG